MRSPIFSTTWPSATDRTVASSVVSAPVSGLVRTTRMVWPTDFSSSFCGVSRSKSKFCSTMSSGVPRPVSNAVSGRMPALTSMKATSFSPWVRVTVRESRTSARSLL